MKKNFFFGSTSIARINPRKRKKKEVLIDYMFSAESVSSATSFGKMIF